ncbi:MAG: hypothetical protein IJL66_05385 [Lachnospiraceae bacterium]|nr:hypothetical protein [Lachnospiraceae bacterium]
MKFDHLFELVSCAPTYRTYVSGDVFMRLDFLSDMLRVALVRKGTRLLPTFSVCPPGCAMPREGRDKLSVEGFDLAAPQICECAGENAAESLSGPSAGISAGVGDVVAAPEDAPAGQAAASDPGKSHFAPAPPERTAGAGAVSGAAPLGEHIEFDLAGLHFRVELRNFRITARSEKGIVYQDRNGLAYNFAGELGDGSVHFTRRAPGQKIYGLGDKCGNVDKSGRSFALGAGDAMGFLAESMDPLYKQIPFWICEIEAGAYGIYYDTYANGRVDFGQEHDNYFEPFNSIRVEEENLVFYLIPGTPMEIIRAFTRLCGGAAPVPDWAFAYGGSTMEYTDAPDSDARLRSFLDTCRSYGIRPGSFYLSSGYTQIGDRRCVFHWNRDKFPDPAALAAHFRENGVHFVPNIKPGFLTDHPLYAAAAEHGWFLHYADGTPAVFPFWGGMASYLDFTNPDAAEFWKTCVKEQLAANGYTDLWNDNNEYDVWDKDVLACGFGQPVEARRIRPLFSYLMARASREAVEEYKAEQAAGAAETGASAGAGAAAGECTGAGAAECCSAAGECAGAGSAEKCGAAAEPMFNVSRCAVAGMQRVATTWTGDNFTSFRDLRYNHKQAMTMALTGFLFFGQDIGGFAGPSPAPELFLRWIQYGVFTPRFVLHSWKPGEPSTMPWLYPNLMPAVCGIFDARARLLPYLAAEAERCRQAFEPLIRPVFLNYPGYDPEADCFLVGEKILACPVFDEGARGVTVTLPGAPDAVFWRLRGEGEPIPGGTEITAACAPTDLPVWFEKV